MLREEPSILGSSDDTYISDYLARNTRYLQLDRSLQPGKVISAWACEGGGGGRFGVAALAFGTATRDSAGLWGMFVTASDRSFALAARGLFSAMYVDLAWL